MMADEQTNPAGKQGQHPAQTPQLLLPAPKTPRLLATLDWIWRNTSAITSWIQVVALFVGAYWAYTRFFRVEAPSLETTARVGLQLDNIPKSGPCRMTPRVAINNDGHSSFDVGSVQIRIVHSTLPHTTDDTPAYFNVDEMERGVEILKSIPPDSYLNLHYPPGGGYAQSFTWEFKQLNGLYFIKAEVFDAKGKLLGSGRVWDEVSCGQ